MLHRNGHCGSTRRRSSRLIPLLAALLLISRVVLAQGGGNDAEAELPGKTTDPDIIIPPGERQSFSGAPVAWKNGVMDSRLYSFVMADRFEFLNNNAGDARIWDAQGWLGDDYNKAWVKTEGEGTVGEELESAELQILYSRTTGRFWNFQAGVRHDFKPDTRRNFAVFGIQGLAPYWFEVDSALFIGEKSDIRWRGELEYDLRFTQRLILQPRLEINASLDDVPEYGLGGGINNSELGLRLRYEFRREFAPYLGVSWEKKYGDTADIARASGEPDSVTSFVVGVRAWF